MAMVRKDIIDNFNIETAKKLGVSLQKALVEENIISKGIGYNIFKDYIYRILSFYSSIDFNDLCTCGKVDKIKEKETQIEFETYVMQPDIWEQWKRTWDYQKPLHDKSWLKRVQKEEVEEYDENNL